jgi:DNA-binding YbaB/EbfC family protein
MMGLNPKMLQNMQKQMMQIQENLGHETVEASVGGGAITVTMTGHQKVTAIKIDPDAVEPGDIGALEELLLLAVNEAVTKSQELAAKKMSALTGGMRLPGLM